MSLTSKERKALKSQAHALKPVVIIGNLGLTANVLAEIGRALAHHELIKVKIASDDRETRQALAQTISEETEADLVQIIGQIAVFYHPSAEA